VSSDAVTYGADEEKGNDNDASRSVGGGGEGACECAGKYGGAGDAEQAACKEWSQAV
jgi:hypothetical protein